MLAVNVCGRMGAKGESNLVLTVLDGEVDIGVRLRARYINVRLTALGMRFQDEKLLGIGETD